MRFGTAILISTLVHAVALSIHPHADPMPKPKKKLEFPVRTLHVRLPSGVKPPNSGSNSASAPFRKLPPEVHDGEGAVDAPPEIMQHRLPPDHYFSPSELDTRPVPILFFNTEQLELSAEAEGRATVQLWVNADGKVAKMEIEHSGIPDEMLQILIQDWRKLRFEPGMKNGISVNSVVRYEISLISESRKRLLDSTKGTSTLLNR